MSHQPVQVSVFVDANCRAGLALLIKESLAVAGTLHARSADLLTALPQYRAAIAIKPSQQT